MGAMWSLAASNCALAARATSPERRDALLSEAARLLGDSRAFKQELVDRGIDAREASAALVALQQEAKKCEAVRAGRAGG